MADAVFLTGATGFLGTEMVYELVSTVSSPVYVLVRANSKEEAIHRLKASWYPIPNLYNKIGVQVFPVTGDFTKADLGFSAETATLLQENTGYVIHSGAEVKKIPGLKRFMQISTACRCH